ncbi:response regulator [Paenibacillus campinasensis]|uniref:Response regulator n=1 Tax=Paenibacillus campinasensis TaxID=66347 RepID=A0ABW9T0S6_9BACL|nr:response regulator [Paenibacillus campinasensis]MUG65281.1 response regulator [Paenibacillus campinasensis]
MRILVVDDEPLVRIGIKSAIDWQAHGAEIVGEAEDGEQALRMMTELSPDVVLLDIKMPKMDGIEVLRVAKDRQLPPKIVVLSSFDEMVYVKEAMKLGAFDYFHKPDMNEQELTAMLNSIREQFGVSHIPASPGMAADAAASGKDKALYDALHGHSFDLSGTSLKEGNIYVVLFRVKQYHSVMKRYSEGSEMVLPSTIQHVIQEMLSSEKEIEYLRLSREMSAVLISNSELKSLLASLNRVNNVVQMISSALKRFVNIDIILGISDWCADFTEIARGYKQASKALSHYFYRPDDAVFYYQHLKVGSSEVRRQADEAVVQMKSALRDGDSRQFLDLLGRWEQLLLQGACMDPQDVKKVYEGLLFMMGEGAADSTAVGSDGPMRSVEEIESFRELSAYYRLIFEERLGSRERKAHKGYSQLTRNIIAYAEEHYKDSLSLKLFGDQFHVSPNYVSRLFKQEVGQGLFDYINALRIEKAKELLKDYRYKIYDVAEMVGFHNQAHFAIVFQKYAGVSPKQYRKEEV